MKDIDISALGQVIDSSWGRSNSTTFGSTVNICSVKASLLGEDKLKVTYLTVVNMVRDREMIESKTLYDKEADSYVEAAVKKIATDYEDETGDPIKFDRLSADTHVEIVNLNHFNQRRSAYLRRVVVFEIA